ncbi:MAG: hypothetical protein HUU16_17490 [Candidatus Omnitrophica bacterium]|nr:hypothetical protein [Candidatus Omnitrophota bacterium]
MNPSCAATAFPQQGVRRAVFALLLAGLMLPGVAFAVSPESWRISSYSDFSQGESERVSIVNPGEIRLSPSHQVFSVIRDPSVWSLAESPDGSTLYVGTGNSAKVYKVATGGSSATAEAKLFADLDGNAVYTLLPGKQGELYAGVSPEGKVFKIAPDGSVTLIGESDEDYIWAMVFDATGDLILATGGKGLIKKMTLEGKTKTLVKTEEKHILSLAADPTGKIYFGTAPNGWVGLLENQKDFRVLHDSELSEVKALALDSEGSLYAGIIPSLQVEQKRDVPQPPQGGGGPKTDKSSELVKISPNGLARSLGKTANAAINTLNAGPFGILVGTGDEGKLFQIGFREDLDLVADFEKNDLLAIIPRKAGGLWIGTGNPGSVIAFPMGTNKGGVYASKALDAETPSQWGRMSWVASIPEGVTLAFETRSGNTKEPDDTWSDWSEPLNAPGKASSPVARFLQWRAKFGGSPDGKSATVEEVEIIHQSLNQPPRIESVQFGDQSATSGNGGAAGAQAAKSDSAGAKTSSSKSAQSEGGSTAANPNLVQLSWQATDPNGDTLIYDLHYRRVSENLWKEIETDLKTAKHPWNVLALPDGDYEVRLIASDRLANPPDQAASDRWRSEPIRVDKTAPEVVEWLTPTAGAGTYDVEARVVDATSRLVGAEAILDGDEDKPIPLVPKDGIADTNEETYKIHVEGLVSGEHSLVVRAKDEKGNIGSGAHRFTLP